MKKASSKAADYMPRVQLSVKDFARGRNDLIEIVLPGTGENGEDGLVYMKKLGVAEAFEFATLERNDLVMGLVPLVGRKTCDVNGNLIFDPNDPESMEILSNMDPKIFDKLSDCISEQMVKADTKEKQEKNA